MYRERLSLYRIQARMATPQLTFLDLGHKVYEVSPRVFIPLWICKIPTLIENYVGIT